MSGAEDIHNCCRICLDAEREHVSIESDPSIRLHMKSCLGITFSNNDHLPKSICVTCEAQLTEFYHLQLNARCSQDWLESCIYEKVKKYTEMKAPVQPLPDSEYNSDSLLEFLNNTANIEEYLSNLGKEDIPSIVNMLDKNNENSLDSVTRLTNTLKAAKVPSPKKTDTTSATKSCNLNMDIDVLDSDIEIVQEILTRETEPKPKTMKSNETVKYSCFACKLKCDNIDKLSQHITICDTAQRTCVHCHTIFNSKKQMLEHCNCHHTVQTSSCNCGKQFPTKEKLKDHYQYCSINFESAMVHMYRCKKCGNTFKDRLLLYKHAKEHVKKEMERICDICSHIFVGDKDLDLHKKNAHNIDKLMYRCKVCKHTSNDRKEIYLHIKQEHSLKSTGPAHLCEACGRCFATRATLHRHLLTHPGSDRQRCRSCNKLLVNKKERDLHICDTLGKVMCERCGQRVSKAMMSLHPCVNTPMETSEQNGKVG